MSNSNSMGSQARKAKTKQLPDPGSVPALSVSPHVRLPKGYSLPIARKVLVSNALNAAANSPQALPLTALQPSPVIVTLGGAGQSKHVEQKDDIDSTLPTSSTVETANTVTTAGTTAPSSPRMTPSSPTTTASTSEPADSVLASSITSSAAVSKSWADLVRSPTRSISSPLQRAHTDDVHDSPQQPAGTHVEARSPRASVRHTPNQPPRQPQQPQARARSTSASTSTAVKDTPSSFSAVLSRTAEPAAQTVIPRGLVNSGNLCFINAVLQLIVYTQPFWKLCLELRHSTTNDLRNPRLLDAVISFLSEFRVCAPDAIPDMYAAQPGPSKLSPQVVQDPPFVPSQVYESLKGNKRFDSMRRGTQEDAEEFLGFLLETLHEELIKMDADEEEKQARRAQQQRNAQEDDDWVEVGTKGKVAVTRTTELKESALTQILGGSLRSTLRCAGNKDSVTLEPFQRLQLDIQPAHVRSVEDALLHLCAPEQLPDFHPRASKQLSFDTLPPILILHLKRFLYTAAGGTQKSDKRIQYRHALEIDERCISPAKRGQKKIRYRLYGVVYHHGSSAHGGHYTVALRSNSPQVSFVTSTVTGAREAVPAGVAEWIHIDDTNVRAVSPYEVASSGPTPSQDGSASALVNGSSGGGGSWTDVLRTNGGTPTHHSHHHSPSSMMHVNEDNERDAYLLCYFRET